MQVTHKHIYNIPSPERKLFLYILNSSSKIAIIPTNKTEAAEVEGIMIQLIN
jgi:hypothetical protein